MLLIINLVFKVKMMYMSSDSIRGWNSFSPWLWILAQEEGHILAPLFCNSLLAHSPIQPLCSFYIIIFWDVQMGVLHQVLRSLLSFLISTKLWITCSEDIIALTDGKLKQSQDICLCHILFAVFVSVYSRFQSTYFC
jgi:hypothetical protein